MPFFPAQGSGGVASVPQAFEIYSAGGIPANGQFGTLLAPAASTMPDACVGSFGTVRVAPTAALDGFVFAKFGVAGPVASWTIAIGANDAVFATTGSGDAAVAAGDHVAVVCNQASDATAVDFSFTIVVG